MTNIHTSISFNIPLVYLLMILMILFGKCFIMKLLTFGIVIWVAIKLKTLKNNSSIPIK